jgi:hypothetical protein
LLGKQEAKAATTTLCRLVHTLNETGAFASSDDHVRQLARRAVVACLEAAGQEAKEFLVNKQYEASEAVAQRLAEEIGGPARAAGLGQALRDFQASHAYLASLARAARR